MTDSEPLKRVWVLGWPISHSRSPLIHNHWIKAHGIQNALYETHAVQPEDLASCLQSLKKAGVIGANVTVPHKEAVFALLDHHDAAAKRLGAVNTLVDCGTHLEGRNTDGYGFMANLKSACPDFDFTAGPATVLGAGGAARAIVAALSDAGAPEIRLINRTVEKAKALLTELDVTGNAMPWPTTEKQKEAALGETNLLVNTSSLGMKNMAPLDLSLDFLPTTALVTDIVYAPLETDLLTRARARGNRTVDGLGMLLHQAVPGFEAWFGIRPEVTDELRNLVLEDLGEK